MLVEMTSQLTQKNHVLDLDITEEQLLRITFRRESGELIQDIVPHLCKEDREFLMTGITQEEWEHVFGEQMDYNS
jgi:hypothetical protein